MPLDKRPELAILPCDGSHAACQYRENGLTGVRFKFLPRITQDVGMELRPVEHGAFVQSGVVL